MRVWQPRRPPRRWWPYRRALPLRNGPRPLGGQRRGSERSGHVGAEPLPALLHAERGGRGRPGVEAGPLQLAAPCQGVGAGHPRLRELCGNRLPPPRGRQHRLGAGPRHWPRAEVRHERSRHRHWPCRWLPAYVRPPVHRPSTAGRFPQRVSGSDRRVRWPRLFAVHSAAYWWMVARELREQRLRCIGHQRHDMGRRPVFGFSGLPAEP
mmetsp:Transcript_71109/g.230109  ORF Transcript_71109/g.230109 Transcript_71109/m.230109 type:complete len:209 (+) Transcript_71109:731-1357(+)